METNTAAILTANSNFYDAFANGSAKSMSQLWSCQESISCIHPGWPPLFGSKDVINSWQSILSSNPPLIAYSRATAHIHGNIGYVICCEHLEPGVLIATNIFSYEDGEWKMIHHQAGIVPSNRDDETITLQ